MVDDGGDGHGGCSEGYKKEDENWTRSDHIELIGKSTFVYSITLR